MGSHSFYIYLCIKNLMCRNPITKKNLSKNRENMEKWQWRYTFLFHILDSCLQYSHPLQRANQKRACSETIGQPSLEYDIESNMAVETGTISLGQQNGFKIVSDTFEDRLKYFKAEVCPDIERKEEGKLNQSTQGLFK